MAEVSKPIGRYFTWLVGLIQREYWISSTSNRHYLGWFSAPGEIIINLILLDKYILYGVYLIDR